MSGDTTDPVQNYQISQAATEARRASTLSQEEGRAVDANGFSTTRIACQSPAAERLVDDELAAVIRRDDRRRRLLIARWTAAAKEQARKEAEENRRRAMEEFELPELWQVMTIAELWPEAYRKVVEREI